MEAPDLAAAGYDLAAEERRAWKITSRVLRKHFRPPSRLTVSEWADRYRILPEGSAAAGRWRTGSAPYLREMMDVCSDIDVERVVVMKGAQVGFSEVLLNILAYYIDQDPSLILFVQISTGEAEKFSKERIAPAIADSPRLRDKVSAPRSRDSENTIESKKFTGGHLGIVGANAPSGLRSRPRRIVLFDEVDGYPPSAGDEGDPIDLATRRTRAFWNRLIVMGSTPTLKDFSRIESAFRESDQRYFLVPCPECDHRQRLAFENLKWDKDGKRHLTDTAAYCCEKCGVLIPERKKTSMLARGRWVAHNPDSRIVGFHISALYAPWVRWSELADEFLAAKDHPGRLQVFVNTTLGETWDDKGSTVEADPLHARREDFPAAPLPARVAALTAGVDVGADHIELEVVGWGPGEESWSIDYLRILGDPSTAAVWKDLDAVIKRTWKHPAGPELRLAATCIDSRHMTQQVLKFCKDRFGLNVWAIHGVDGPGRPIMDRPSNKNKLRVPRFPVGVDTAKGLVYARLQIGPESGRPPPAGTMAGYCHFPKRDPYDEEYFRQLTSEKLVLKATRRGEVKPMWIRRPNRRAEALDCRVYATAAIAGLQIAGLDLDQRLADITVPPLPPDPDADFAGRGGWVNNY
jgi:phage terminase large subunit GpA-like protein